MTAKVVGNNEILSNITIFISNYKNHIRTIKSLSPSRNSERYAKILYFSALEGIAKTMYPRKNPHNRFVKMLNTLGSWDEGGKISLSHLVGALERTSNPEFEEIRQYAYSKLLSWGSGGPRYLQDDPDFSEIQRRWPRCEGQSLTIPCLRLKLTNLRHFDLLYEYRNYLVHQSLQPTQSPAEKDETFPFYEAFEDRTAVPRFKVSEWHLIYPTNFLDKLCKNCLAFLDHYLIKNLKDPYCIFKNAHYCIEKLNDDSRFPVLNGFYVQEGGKAEC